MWATSDWITGCSAVGSSLRSTWSRAATNRKRGSSWNFCCSSCPTRSQRMSEARMARPIMPSEWDRTILNGLPTSLTMI